MRIKEKESKIFESLKGTFGWTNKMQAPRLIKVVVNTGVGTVKDKKKLELIPDRLAKVTGQKPSARPSKQSVASFKSRQGDIIGHQITLRGARMYDFLDKLVNIALPRTKDFRGLNSSSIDEMGNYSIGIKEHTIFPETVDEELKDIFGMTITVVTSSSDKKVTKAFLEKLGFPFKKEEEKKRK